MNVIKIFVIAIIAVFAFNDYAAAQTNKKKVRRRQVNQTARIAQGAKSGELTKKETVRLAAQQKHIQKTKRKAKADGVVTPREKAKIKRKQNRASANIAAKKNNSKSRK